MKALISIPFFALFIWAKFLHGDVGHLFQKIWGFLASPLFLFLFGVAGLCYGIGKGNKGVTIGAILVLAAMVLRIVASFEQFWVIWGVSK